MFKKFKRSSPTWTPDEISYNWVSSTGRRINLQDDICICVSSLEDIYLRRHARVALLEYGLLVQVQTEALPKPGILGALVKYFRDRDTSIFGVGLERSLEIERRLHKYPRQRINAQYRLHLPYHYIGSIRSINEFGLLDDKVLHDEGNPLWMVDQLQRGDTLPYESPNNVHELSTILKIFLRELPGGLLTEDLEGLFLLAGGRRVQSKRIKLIQLLVQALPRANREALFLLMSLSRQVVLATTQNTTDVASALRRVLFINDNKTTSDLGIIVTIDAMITKFEDVFNLPAETLDYIYQELAKFHPKKLSANIERRINKRLWENSDIPENLMVLYKRHSYETCSFETFYKAEDSSSATTLGMVHDFLDRSTSTFRRRRQHQEPDLHRLKEILQRRVTYFPTRGSKFELRPPQEGSIDEVLKNGSNSAPQMRVKPERRHSF